jgi:3-hydroxyacyl-CoA dehydrogenase
MTVNDIKKICVVGAGNMGRRFPSAHSRVQNDLHRCRPRFEKAEKFADTYLQESGKGKMTKRAEQPEEHLLHPGPETGGQNADFSSGGPEILDVKRLFAGSTVKPAHAILATTAHI